MTDLRDLAALSRHAASSVDVVQGGGGNTSVKSSDGRLIHIKASGVRLADLTESYGFVSLDLSQLLEIVNDPSYISLPPKLQQERSAGKMQECVVSGTLRPSLETGFHALLGRFIIHTHPVAVNVGTCLIGDSRELLKLYQKEFGSASWVSYRAPGHALALEIASALGANGAASISDQVLLLENHGLIVAADSVERAIQLSERCIELANKLFGALSDFRGISNATSELNARKIESALQVIEKGYSVKRIADGCVLEALRRFPEIFFQGPLFPDDVVYWGRAPFVADSYSETGLADLVQDISAAELKQGLVIGAQEEAYVFGPKPSTLIAIEEVLHAHAAIRLLAVSHGKLRSLPAAEIDFLCNMEGEKYRREIAAANS